MKATTLTAGLALLLVFAACTKKDSATPKPPAPPASTITFTLNGNAVNVININADTTREAGFEYPQIVIKGLATMASPLDTLSFELQILNDNNTLSSVTQFTGSYSDTNQIHHLSTVSLSSSLNYDTYQDHWDYYNNFSTMITSNDGKTVAGTFSGTLFTTINNNNAPAKVPVANGVFKISL